jgi:coproporphyrinogen III oxidase-like Fe-S oxidoreductase
MIASLRKVGPDHASKSMSMSMSRVDILSRRGSRNSSRSSSSSAFRSSRSSSSARSSNDYDSNRVHEDERKKKKKENDDHNDEGVFKSRLFGQRENRLQTINGAYVHLPFCVQKCHYCDFATQIIGDRNRERGTKQYDQMEEYCAFVVREITHQGVLRNGTSSSMMSSRSSSASESNALSSIFFGGGTPSVVPARMIEQILKAIEKQFGIASECEISMECDPGTFTRDELRQFVSVGVNRVSLGIQSFDEVTLKSAGRAHGVLENYRAIEDVHAVGSSIKTWSIDLISGLPGSSLESWEKGLFEAIDSGAPHVSAYDLQVEDKTAFGKWYADNDDNDKANFMNKNKGGELKLEEKNRDKRTLEMKQNDAKAKAFENRMDNNNNFNNKNEAEEDSRKRVLELSKATVKKKTLYKMGDRLPLPDESVVAQQYKMASEILTKRGGFHRYEISSFAKGEENECLHNKNYWNAISGSWYAFGLSATSRIDNERVARPRGMKQYYGFVTDFEQNSFGSEEAFSKLRKDATDAEVIDEIADAILERIMLGFRTSKGVDMNELQRSFGSKVCDELLEALKYASRETDVKLYEEIYSSSSQSKKDVSSNSKTITTGYPDSIRLTDPEGFLVSTEIISTVISRMPTLKDA